MTEEKIRKPVIIVGIGQLGGVFARGFLQAGHPVYPVTREARFSVYPGRIPEPALVLLAVPEDGIAEALREVPAVWRDRIGLLQNELLPYVWEAEKIAAPTAMAVWFEKKKDREVKVFQPTLVFGPAAGIVCSALTALNIPCEILPDAHHLVLALVRKNLYVLTINIAGLETGGTVGELWSKHNALAHQIEAGSDFFLMPSAYEPCGLSQMYSLRYGTLPIVRRTGGLADTVENYDETTGGGTGLGTICSGRKLTKPLMPPK